MASSTAPVEREGSSLSRAEFEELGTEELIQYLATQKVMLSEKVQAIFWDQEIDGDSLTGMTAELLISGGVLCLWMRSTVNHFRCLFCCFFRWK